MIPLVVLTTALLDYRAGTTLEYRTRQLLKLEGIERLQMTQSGLAERWSIPQLLRTGLLAQDTITWFDENYQSLEPREVHFFLDLISETNFQIPPTLRRFVHTLLHNNGMPYTALEFFLQHGEADDAANVATVLGTHKGNYTDMEYLVIRVLDKIGTPDEIAVIDKAKENGLLATDGDFWKKAADAKKAIQARAEAKKNAELKAKPLDK